MKFYLGSPIEADITKTSVVLPSIQGKIEMRLRAPKRMQTEVR
jgi:hypothetical protein